MLVVYDRSYGKERPAAESAVNLGTETEEL